MTKTIWMSVLLFGFALGCGDGDGGDEVDSGLRAPQTSACSNDCGPGELCVVTYDGVCGQISAQCVATACTNELQCSAACDQELCSAPTTCTGSSCQADLADDFFCYGP